MGKKDVYQFDYLDDDRRFADQINGALFGGKQIVKPEELEPEDSQIVSIGLGTALTGRTGHAKAVVDKVRVWRGTRFHIFVVENQNYVDYQMVLRNMLSESIGYRRQWKRKQRVHTEQKDLEGKERYDMCKAFEDMRLEGYEAGMAEGMAEGITKGMAEGIEKLVKSAKNFRVSKLSAREQLIQQYALSEQEANEKIEKYWTD